MAKRNLAKATFLLILIFGQIVAAGWIGFQLGIPCEDQHTKIAQPGPSQKSAEQTKHTEDVTPSAGPQIAADGDVQIASCGTFAAGIIFYVIPAVTVVLIINVVAVFAAVR